MKRYDGQSPLQVALKDSNTQIIELLLSFSPDVNFIEGESCSNPWRTPVIHDSINRAIMCSRWNINRPDRIEVFNDKISHGADLQYISPNAFGQTYIERYKGETVCEFLK